MAVEQRVFRINERDNVATALGPLEPGTAKLLGDGSLSCIRVLEPVAAGHKIALEDISREQAIVKYGVVIGRAVKGIPRGTWVHLHCMKSLYDERSGHLDVVTGAPKDIRYE